jgi:hypothetical protein
MTALLAICLVVLVLALLAAYAITRKSGLEISGGSGFFWFRLSVPSEGGKPTVGLDSPGGSPTDHGQEEAHGIAGHRGPTG